MGDTHLAHSYMLPDEVLAEVSPLDETAAGCGTTFIGNQRWQARPQPSRGSCDTALDAEAIGAAVTRPTSRVVPITRVEPQDLQALHRVRERLIKAYTALALAIR